MLALLVLAACGNARGPLDAGVDAGVRVRVATFNTHRFFDTVCQSGQCAPGDYEVQPNQATFDARARALAGAISTFDADVVSLQEVETQACLDALLADLGAPWTGVLGEIGDPASVDVAVLSRTPIEQVVLHRASAPLLRPDGSNTIFSRELPEVHVHVRGVEVILFAAHFRSKVSDDPGRRLAEAQKSRVLVEAVAAAHPSALVVLAGDLNDTPGSPPIDALTLDGGLTRVAEDLPVALQATYVYNGVGDAIDHVLQAASAGVQPVPRSSQVLQEVKVSDHFPLITDFEQR
jgi:endonuclease/exonuclease/phosphatase family metal-dependent hydrolase